LLLFIFAKFYFGVIAGSNIRKNPAGDNHKTSTGLKESYGELNGESKGN